MADAPISSSTRNMLMATFRNVLKVARDDGLIDVVPGPASAAEGQSALVLPLCTVGRTRAR